MKFKKECKRCYTMFRPTGTDKYCIDCRKQIRLEAIQRYKKKVNKRKSIFVLYPTLRTATSNTPLVAKQYYGF